MKVWLLQGALKVVILHCFCFWGIGGVHGFSAEVPSPRRNLDDLSEWATSNGVTLGDGVQIRQVDAKADDWTIVMEQGATKEEGSVLMSVPQHLVLTSEKLLLQDSGKRLEGAFQQLRAANLGHHQPEFCLWLQLVRERTHQSSKWVPWFQSLPQSFTTGIGFSNDELDCLPPFSRALADYQTTLLQTFVEVATENSLLAGTKNSQKRSAVKDDQDMYRWAFNVVYSRCWQVSPDISHIVPMGDLFNHKEPANVVLRYNNNKSEEKEEDSTVDFVFKSQDMTTTTDTNVPLSLYLSYGITNPHRLLVLFGFVDPSMPEIWCEIVFSNPTPDHVSLGCQDRSKMVYRIGATNTDDLIPETVWDCVLYALLAQVPNEQKAFYRAHATGDDLGKAKIHAEYAFETILWQRNYVAEKVQELEELLGKVEQQQTPYSDNLSLIRTHNEFLKSAFEKVKDRLEDLLQEQRELRGRIDASSKRRKRRTPKPRR